MRRFSRLYPLHLATLAAVALGFAVFGAVVYRHDTYHFILNFFLVSSVGLESGFSYNGPSWSISVECVLYAVFFLGCRWLGSRGLLCVLGMIVGLELQPIYEHIARGLIAFFAGGAAYLAHRTLPGRTRPLVILAAAFCWLATLAGVYFADYAVPELAKNTWALLLLFPLTLLVLATPRDTAANRIKPFQLLGDISYSMYLLHFPLQLIFMQFALPFNAGWVMLLFFALLVPLAIASHYHFEVPLQNWMRGALIPSSTATGTAR